MEYLYKGGLLGLSLFVMIVLEPLPAMTRCKGNRMAQLLCVLFALSWLVYMFEYRINTPEFWILPMLLYNVERFAYVPSRSAAEAAQASSEAA